MLAVLRGADLLACVVAFAVVWALAPQLHPDGEFNRTVAGTTLLAAALLTMPVFSRLGLYTPQRTRGVLRQVSGLTRGVFVAWCLAYVAVSLLIPERPSRVVMGLLLPTWLAVAVATRLTGRLLLREARKRGFNLRHAVIVGDGRLGQRLYHELRRNRWMGIEPRFFVHDRPEEGRVRGMPAVGPYEEIDRIVRELPVDIVFLALPARDHEKLEKLLEKLSRSSSVEVRVVPDMLSYNLLRHELEPVGSLPVVTLTHTPLDGWNAVLKRTLDLCVSFVAIVALAPVMAVLCAAVRLGCGPGPVLYRQTRTSLGGETFEIIKFRTMVDGAEDATGPVFADGAHDPRLTKVGGFLRRWNLDELPQFWNVLKGDMSLVGPRPERPELVERFREHIPRYMLRQSARAGLTGWAQVNGLRGRTSLRKRVQYDLFYLCNWSVGFDVKILLMTLNPFGGKKRHRPVELRDEAVTQTPKVPAAKSTRAADLEPASTPATAG